MRVNPHSKSAKAGQIIQMSRSPRSPASLQKQDGGLAMTQKRPFAPVNGYNNFYCYQTKKAEYTVKQTDLDCWENCLFL